MNALQDMDMNQFIIIAPTFLIVVYIVIKLQNKLSNGKNVHYGLIIPVVCFVVATILAFRPLFLLSDSGAEGLIGASLTVWMTFNIPTLALLFPYFMGLKNRKTNQLIMEAMAKEAAEAEFNAAETAEETEKSEA